MTENVIIESKEADGEAAVINEMVNFIGEIREYDRVKDDSVLDEDVLHVKMGLASQWCDDQSCPI